MKRHCPRCGKPEAIVVTTKTHHSADLGRIDEENWRCEDCFFHFKLHSPIWDGFWILAGIVFTVCAILGALGVVKIQKGQEMLMVLILSACGLGAGIYGYSCARMRAKAPPVK